MAAMKSHLKYAVPNGFTAMSMLFGLASVAASASGDFDTAAWMVLWGVLLDKLDGASARLLKASSEFGVQFDSFADFIVFGVAPAALVYFRMGDLVARPLLLFCVGFFVVATSARLARFNIAEPPLGDRLFYGIPTTLVGAVLAAAYLTWSKYGLSPEALSALPFLLIVAGAAMVSNLRLPKLKMRANKLVNAFQLANIVIVYAMTPFKVLPEYLLFLCALYLSVGLTWGLLNPPSEDEVAAAKAA